MSHLSDFLKAKVIVRWEDNHSIKSISRELGVARNTVRLWIRRYQEIGEVKCKRPGPSAIAFTEESERHRDVVKLHLENPFKTTRSTAVEYNISQGTIHRLNINYGLFIFREYNLMERSEKLLSETKEPNPEDMLGVINMFVIYSAVTEFTKYRTNIKESVRLPDTFIYQTRSFDFKVENVGNVPMKILWSFSIDDEYPCTINKQVNNNDNDQTSDSTRSAGANSRKSEVPNNNDVVCESQQLETAQETSKESLFSNSSDRNSVDTWFEVDLPFKIEPSKECLKPKSSQIFKLTFNPLEPFLFRVRLKSSIDNLDPYDQNICCKIKAKSVIPFVHLDIEESDYLVSGRRKAIVTVPPDTSVLEFNVLGSGCYKKSFNIINPTIEGYEFFFEPVLSHGAIDGKEVDEPMVPVHCSRLNGFLEGGTSLETTFTFAPITPGMYESHWRFVVTAHSLVMDLLVVGIVREPQVMFVPAILKIRNALVGFTSVSEVIMKNTENQALKFEFKGSSLCDETGSTPVVVNPDQGVLKPLSETPMTINYTPNQDGSLSFKIFFKVEHLTNLLILCVDTLSQSINPTITYFIVRTEYTLTSENINNIHLKKTASSYERKVLFQIKNDGSATFFYDWNYSCSAVKKFLTVYVEPKSGHVNPGAKEECVLHFTLTKISDGPKYDIYLHAEIEKPVYHFSRKEFDFGKCLVNAPDDTYKRCMGFTNHDPHTILLNLDFVSPPELFVDFKESTIASGVRRKIPIFFRPKEVKEYEWNLRFWVNSLCEEIITIKGEGVPLLFDLNEGCQKSFDLGTVTVGEKVVHTLEVINHSKVQIDAIFYFICPLQDKLEKHCDLDSEGTSMCLDPAPSNQTPLEVGPSRVKLLNKYVESKKNKQIQSDISNAINSLKVFPTKCTLKPHQKITLRIQFKPVGMISSINVQLNSKVLHFVRPLVNFTGSATCSSLRLSNNFILFGLVRRNGLKVKKLTLLNEGDFPHRFAWQPLETDEFVISPQTGVIAPRTRIIFTLTFRPVHINPFIKVWATINIENYKPLEVALYAICLEKGLMEMKTVVMIECPVRETMTEYIHITNPTEEYWLAMAEWNLREHPFRTIREFNVPPNSTLDVPIFFKPPTLGHHEAQVLFSPLGDMALHVTCIGSAIAPYPNGNIEFTVEAKKSHLETLAVFNVTGFPEWYVVSSEVLKITPPNFEGYYEINQPETLRLWGEAQASITWSFVCFEPCEMQIKVVFTNKETMEYQFYNIDATVIASDVQDIVKFSCRARETQQKEVVVRNPLDHDVVFHIYSEKLICPQELHVPRKSQSVLPLLYKPLIVEEGEEYLSVVNNLTGTYSYKVIYKCLPGKVKTMEFATRLGTRIPMRLRAQNQSEYPAEFTTEVSSPSIIPDKDYYALGPGEKGKFLVWFEPTELGVQNITLVFTSPVAGSFEYNIKGVGKYPAPQGPYSIVAGGFTIIRFKNVFNENKSFKVYVDQPDFYVKTFIEAIPAKSEKDIPVYLREKSAFSGTGTEMPTAVLTIEVIDPPRVQWNYYLQGI